MTMESAITSVCAWQGEHPHSRGSFPGERTTAHSSAPHYHACVLPLNSRPTNVFQRPSRVGQVAWGAEHQIVLDFPLLINCAQLHDLVWGQLWRALLPLPAGSAELQCCAQALLLQRRQ